MPSALPEKHPYYKVMGRNLVNRQFIANKKAKCSEKSYPSCVKIFVQFPGSRGEKGMEPWSQAPLHSMHAVLHLAFVYNSSAAVVLLPIAT